MKRPLDPVDGGIDFYVRFLEDRQRGETRTPRDYVTAFPDQIEEIAALFPATEEPPKSARFGDRYDVEEILGVGGQGTVHRARDRRLRRTVALKVLRDLPALHERARLAREAEIVSQLDHPGLCEVFDVETESDAPYIAMKLVPGRPLSELLESAEGEPVLIPGPDQSAPDTTSRIRRYCGFIAQAARALQAAHDAGVVHRDVKPGNLMVTPEGRPVILDFGLARREQGGERLSMTGTLFGTPDYMSPEQIQGQALDARTDIWSLGVVLYEGATGSRPFSAQTREGLLAAIEGHDPRRPTAGDRKLQRDLRAVLDVALAKNPARRYATARAFAADLEALAWGRPPKARPVGRLERSRRVIARHPTATVMLLAILALSGFGGYLLAIWPEVQRSRAADQRQQIVDRLEQAYLDLELLRFTAAGSGFEAVLAEDPNNVEAVVGLLQTRLDQAEPEKVLVLLDRFADVREREPALDGLRVAALRDLGRKQDAEALTEKVPAPVDATDHLVAGLLAFRRGRHYDREAFRIAHDHFTQASLAATDGLQIYQLWRCRAAAEADDEEMAREAAAAITNRWPRSSRAWNAAGYALTRYGADRPRGIEAFREAIELDPVMAMAWNNLGNALKHADEPLDALAAYRRAIEIRPDVAHYHRNLGMMLGSQGRKEEALAANLRAAELAPDDAMVLLNLGQTLHHSGEKEEAFETYQRAASADPDNFLARYNTGICLMQRGRFAEAESHFRHAASLRPDNAGARVQVGWTLLRQDKKQEAAALAGEIVSAHPDVATAHHLLASAHLELDRRGAAIAGFRRALELAPRHTTLNGTIGRLLIQEDQAAKALPFLVAAHEKRPGLRPVALDLARALRRTGAPDEALKILASFEEDPLQSDAEELKRHCEGDVKLGPALEAFVARGVLPSDLGERAALIVVARLRRDHDLITRLWQAVLSSQPQSLAIPVIAMTAADDLLAATADETLPPHRTGAALRLALDVLEALPAVEARVRRAADLGRLVATRGALGLSRDELLRLEELQREKVTADQGDMSSRKDD